MNVEYAKSFLKDVKRLKDRKIAQRLEALLILLESAGDLLEVPGVKSMSGASAYYRIRIGQYRLGVKEIEDGTLLILRFLTRGEIYRYFPK